MKNTNWTISKENDLSKPFGIIECNGVPIACVLQKGVGREQAEVNAKLMASAPELLVMLKKIIDMQKRHYGNGMRMHMILSILANEAEEIINRATKGVSK